MPVASTLSYAALDQLGRTAQDCYHELMTRKSVTPQLLRAAVYGANDGIITTFAVVAGVAGASLSTRVILIMGVSNLIADGIAMGLGDFLGEKSEQDMESSSLKRRPRGGIWHTGLTTFLAFVLVGSAPLLPYFVELQGVQGTDAFIMSILCTVAALFIVGSLRSIFTKRSWLRSGLEMLLVGTIAAGAAFALGAFIDTQI